MASDQLTIFELQEREDARVAVRQLPRLARYGVRLTMAAGRVAYEAPLLIPV